MRLYDGNFDLLHSYHSYEILSYGRTREPRRVGYSMILKYNFRNYQTLISISFQERFGAFFQDLDFPTEEDFNLFDVNEDGTLVYDEWKQSMSE